MLHTSGPRRFRVLVALTCLSLLAAAFGIACAQQKKAKTAAAPAPIVVTCGAHPIKILGTGPDMDPVFVCGGVKDTITWSADSSIGSTHFSVDFEKSPFGDGTGHCDDRDCGGLTANVIDVSNIEVHKYVLVVGKTYFDPHVIIVPGSR
jgi:hypothetical protein